MDFSLINASHPLILASASPRRKALLKQVGLPFSAFRSRIQEERAFGDPMEATCILAREKAQSIYNAGIRGWILGADTIVVIDHCILGKPKDKRDARRMLTALSGREHQVITGVALLNPAGAEVFHRAIRSLVMVKELSAVEIDAYLATGEPFDKAGGYAIQGIGAFMIKGIQGSYTNIVGLPVCEVISALKDAGALGAFP
jgi:septum formation protein